MTSSFIKPSSKESDTDKKENLEKEDNKTVNRLDRSTDTGEREKRKKEGKKPLNRLDQTTACALKKTYVRQSAFESRICSINLLPGIEIKKLKGFTFMIDRDLYRRLCSLNSLVQRLKSLLPTSPLGPSKIPGSSKAQAVEQSSSPRYMIRDKRSTLDSAARKLELIAVQSLPFGMIWNIVYHYLYQKNRIIAGKLLMYMSVFIRSSNDDYIDVWPAYRESAEWDPIFVVLCRTNFQGEWDEYAGLRIFKRHYDFVSSEASQVFNSPSVQETPLEHIGFLTKCIYDTDLITTHSNITIVNVCPIRSRNGGRDLTKETCIVIHCRVKGFIPFTEKPFPKVISTLPVDVREGYFVLGVKTPEPQCDANFLRNSPKTNNGISLKNNSANGHSPTFKTLEQTAGSAGLNGHIAASAIKSPYVLQNNGSEENGDEEMQDDSCRIHEMRVDVLCGQFERLSLAYKELLRGKGQDDFNESLLMGTSISRTGCISSGTLGGFVSLPRGKVGLLTCAHVIGIEERGSHVFDETNQVFVSQPSDGRTSAEYKDRRRECGYVERAVFEPGAIDSTGVDAALVTITDRHPKNGEFIRLPPEQLAVAGFGQANPLKFSKGTIMKFEDIVANRRNDVIKVGSKTGITRGSLYLTDTFVRLSNPGMVPKSGEALAFFNQMEVFNPGFFLPGDSGALVFMPLKDDELHCMGLAIGHTSYSSCLVTPIEHVFKKLKLDSQSFIDFSYRRH